VAEAHSEAARLDKFLLEAHLQKSESDVFLLKQQLQRMREYTEVLEV
jgi:hypothetical protein